MDLSDESATEARYMEFSRVTRQTTFQQLRALPEDELARRYDFLLSADMPFALGPDDYLAELNRRATDRQTTWLVRLTWAIALLTVVLIVLEVRAVLLGH